MVAPNEGQESQEAGWLQDVPSGLGQRDKGGAPRGAGGTPERGKRC